MRSSLDEGLQELTDLLNDMGLEVERILQGSMDALKALDRSQAEYWIAEDLKVNDYERRVDELCVRLIATQQPVAKDLRKIISAMKIAADLERMSDLAIDIAKVVKRIEGPLMKELIDIPKMADQSMDMMRKGLVAYINEDMAVAEELATLDDEVDHLYGQIVRELVELMGRRPETLNQGMYLAFVGRYIERIADHATNIGESVVYISTGERKDLNK